MNAPLASDPRASAHPRPKRWRVILAASAIALTLPVTAELWLRRDGWHERQRDFRFQSMQPQEARTGLLQSDPDLAYRLAPGFRSCTEHAGAYATGPWAFRGRPPTPAPESITRVLVLGDSCVYGVGVNTADTMPANIERELALRGWPPTAIQVLNLGVPGYSTEQIALLLERSLSELAPAAIVLYPAAWNDQAPALARPDRELVSPQRRRVHDGLALTNWLAHLKPAPEPMPADEVEAIQRAWKDGEARFGARVPTEAVGANVRRMLKACAERDVAALVVLPAHPQRTRAAHPRLHLDRQVVERVARDAGARVCDATAILDRARIDDRGGFIDFVHTSPQANRAIGAAVAEHLVALLPAPPRIDATGPTVVAIRPAAASSLGDVMVEVQLDRSFPRGEVPAVMIGGAPLLDVHLSAPDVVRGKLMTNTPGRYDVLVQTSEGVAHRPQGFGLQAPRIETRGGELRFVSRPGDRALVVAATALWPEPTDGPQGTAYLDPEALVASFGPLTAGPDGSVALGLDPGEIEGPLWFQALVTPRGESEGSKERRYSELLALP